MNYNVAGISKEGLERSKEAIDEYLKNLDKIRSEINNNVNYGQAFVGEYKAAAQNFVKEITSYMYSYESTLEDFYSSLDQAYSNYVRADEEIASEIGETNSGIGNGELGGLFEN